MRSLFGTREYILRNILKNSLKSLKKSRNLKSQYYNKIFPKSLNANGTGRTFLQNVHNTRALTHHQVKHCVFDLSRLMTH